VPCHEPVAASATKCIKYIKKRLYLIEKSCYFVCIRETFISDQVMLQPSVLLVEDDAFQRKAAETYLMNHDLRVIAVENGAQMRRQISRAMPDLVLLDVQLPGQEDGFALARWLRESNTKVGIIMLTAAGDSVDKVLGLGERRRRLRRQALRTARASGALQERAAPLGQQVERRPSWSGSAWGNTCSTCPSASCSIRSARTVALTSGEFDILKTFAENPNRPLSRELAARDDQPQKSRPVRPRHRSPHHPHQAARSSPRPTSRP